MATPRIVSLLPSRHRDRVRARRRAIQLVGISHEVRLLRTRSATAGCPLTRSRIDVRGTSRAIDTAVRAVITDALSIYAVDDEGLSELAPDVIVTQDLCEVCAVSLDDVRAAQSARLAHRDDVEIVSLSPTRLADVLGDVERVAGALGRRDDGTAVRVALEQRIQAISERASCVPPLGRAW